MKNGVIGFQIQLLNFLFDGREHWIRREIGRLFSVRICIRILWTKEFNDFDQYSAFHFILHILLLEIGFGSVHRYRFVRIRFWIYESTMFDIYFGNKASILEH